MPWFRSRYAMLLERLLEEERAENRRLLNVIFPTRGLQPLDPEARPEKVSSQHRIRRRSWGDWAKEKAADAAKKVSVIMVGDKAGFITGSRKDIPEALREAKRDAG